MLRGPDALSPRELYNLVANLPSDSAVARASEGDAAWTVEEHLVAGVVDELRFMNGLLYKAHRFKPASGAADPTFAPLRRPGAAVPVEEPPAVSSPAEVRAFFGAARFIPQGG